MDGTFLPRSKVLSEVDLAAVREFESRGGNFTVATGRALQSSEQYFEKLDLKMPLILYNGAVIYDLELNNAIYKSELPYFAREMAQEILDAFPEAGCEVLALDKIYVPRSNEYENLHMQICRITPDFRSISDIPNGWIKVLFALNPLHQPDMIEYVNKKNYKGVSFVPSERHFFEMLPDNVSKGSALIEMIRLLKMEDYTVFAVGDYNNDIEMIKAADYGFATANALPEVKDSADIVLKRSCDENPISEVINFIYNKT